jgi:hypothetical protein
LIRYIVTEADVGEEVSEEIICAGCRELTRNLERYKDVILGGGASLYFFRKVVNGVNGAVERRVVTPSHHLQQPDGLFDTFDIPVKGWTNTSCMQRIWSTFRPWPIIRTKSGVKERWRRSMTGLPW